MSIEMKKSFGGLKVRSNNEININLFCELCKLLLLKPIQLLCCGSRSCQSCSENGLPNSEPFICPFCQAKQPKKQVQADRGVERELNIIQIDCYACSWSGSYKDYQEHSQQQHVDLECFDCHACFYTINSYEEHRREICEYRCIPCGLPGCTELIKWSEMKIHYLSAKHQKQLVKVISEYTYWTKRSFYNPNYSTTTASVNDCTRLKSEQDQMNTSSQSTISDSNNIRLLNIDNTTIFPFHKHNEEINAPFSMYSPTFRTSPYGYAFILRVCSTMESSNGNQGYLSIYLTLLRSDFDQILFYPFPYDISLSLYDQSGQGKHITSTIKPDRNSPSFARPTSEKNNEVGIIKFCPLHYLTDVQSIYCKDDVFFIGIFFDFMDTGSNLFYPIIKQ